MVLWPPLKGLHPGGAGVKTCVVGVPKTIDGDLKTPQVPVSFGFDTACKVYAEMCGGASLPGGQGFAGRNCPGALAPFSPHVCSHAVSIAAQLPAWFVHLQGAGREALGSIASVGCSSTTFALWV